MTEGDMDLYGDDLGGDVCNEEYEGSEIVDLYEDVITSSSGSAGVQQAMAISGGNSAHRFQLYVGNLTWWTTDQDITDAIHSLGITDLIEVKFFDYRPNGQSKGYCLVSFRSDKSMKTCLEGLPKIVFHGQHPVVTYPTKLALIHFEANSKARPTPANNGPQKQVRPMNPTIAGSSTAVRDRMPFPGTVHVQGTTPITVPYWHNGPRQAIPPRPSQAPRHPVSPVAQRIPLPRPDWSKPIPQCFPPQGMLMQPPPSGTMVAPPPNIQPQNTNQIFFPQGCLPSMTNPVHSLPPPNYGPPPQARVLNYPPPSHQDHKLEIPTLSKADFEEIMARNRTVSNSAIARAVSDAAAGEYVSAIETLVTAISLIKQSKIANDDRCKILISSLQDTLHGVETKSYGSSRRERSRSRDRERAHRRSRKDRSRSRDREYRNRSGEREKDRYYTENFEGRNRSRSREREYIDRSREGRYYEDRNKVRERDWEREREVSKREPEREREREESSTHSRSSRH